jgi:hypothetical protein
MNSAARDMIYHGLNPPPPPRPGLVVTPICQNDAPECYPIIDGGINGLRRVDVLLVRKARPDLVVSANGGGGMLFDVQYSFLPIP